MAVADFNSGEMQLLQAACLVCQNLNLGNFLYLADKVQIGPDVDFVELFSALDRMGSYIGKDHSAAAVYESLANRLKHEASPTEGGQ